MKRAKFKSGLEFTYKDVTIKGIQAVMVTASPFFMQFYEAGTIEWAVEQELIELIEKEEL